MKNKVLSKFFKVNSVKRKALKGMSLMEVIIAMVVLVIMSSIVAVAGVGILTNMRTSKSVIQKVNYQSKYVTGKKTKYVSLTGTDGDGNDITEEKNMNKTSITFTLCDSSGSSLGSVNADVYESPGLSEAYEYKDGTYKFDDGTVYDKAGNLKYFNYAG